MQFQLLLRLLVLLLFPLLFLLFVYSKIQVPLNAKCSHCYQPPPAPRLSCDKFLPYPTYVASSSVYPIRPHLFPPKIPDESNKWVSFSLSLSLFWSLLHILLTKINQYTTNSHLPRFRSTYTHIGIQCMLRCISRIIPIGETNFKWWGWITHKEWPARHEGDTVWIGMGEFV